VSEATGAPLRPNVDTAVALVRVAVVALVLAVEALAGRPEPRAEAFEPLLAVIAVYALAVLALSRRGSPPGPRLVYGAVDLLLIGALAHVSGGPSSEVGRTLLVVPLGAALLARPAWTCAWSALALLACLLSAALPPLAGSRPPAEAVAAFVVQLAWAGAFAVAVSWLLAWQAARVSRLAREAADLAASRARHVAAAIDAEDRERRRLAAALHDEAVQNLLAAHQDIVEAGRGRAGRLERARDLVERTVSQLREAIFDLSPHLLEHAGLRGAVCEMVERHAEVAGFAATVEVDEQACGIDDRLVFGVCRELVVNASKHARARNLDVAIGVRDGSVFVAVRDDGVGFDAARRQAALRQGHIGLASTRERVEALGGRFEVEAAPGRGTRVLASVPARRERRRVRRLERVAA
jgi:two-component system NarL family sensor kinase